MTELQGQTPADLAAGEQPRERAQKEQRMKSLSNRNQAVEDLASRRERADAWKAVAREADALGRYDLAVGCRVKAAGAIIGADLSELADELAADARRAPKPRKDAKEGYFWCEALPEDRPPTLPDEWGIVEYPSRAAAVDAAASVLPHGAEIWVWGCVEDVRFDVEHCKLPLGEEATNA